MKKVFLSLLVSVTFGLIYAQANDPKEGYVIVRSDTIYGQINVNFDTGTITVNQDSINRMFLTGIEKITLLNDQRDTYLPVTIDNRQTFYKLLVDGEYPLLVSAKVHFTIINGALARIEEEKDLYNIFGKRNVKDYVFLRDISLSEQAGLKDVFEYFNTNSNF